MTEQQRLQAIERITYGPAPLCEFCGSRHNPEERHDFTPRAVWNTIREAQKREEAERQ